MAKPWNVFLDPAHMVPVYLFFKRYDENDAVGKLNTGHNSGEIQAWFPRDIEHTRAWFEFCTDPSGETRLYTDNPQHLANTKVVVPNNRDLIGSLVVPTTVTVAMLNELFTPTDLNSVSRKEYGRSTHYFLDYHNGVLSSSQYSKYLNKATINFEDMRTLDWLGNLSCYSDEARPNGRLTDDIRSDRLIKEFEKGTISDGTFTLGAGGGFDYTSVKNFLNDVAADFTTGNVWGVIQDFHNGGGVVSGYNRICTADGLLHISGKDPGGNRVGNQTVTNVDLTITGAEFNFKQHDYNAFNTRLSITISAASTSDRYFEVVNLYQMMNNSLTTSNSFSLVGAGTSNTKIKYHNNVVEPTGSGSVGIAVDGHFPNHDTAELGNIFIENNTIANRDVAPNPPDFTFFKTLASTSLVSGQTLTMRNNVFECTGATNKSYWLTANGNLLLINDSDNALCTIFDAGAGDINFSGSRITDVTAADFINLDATDPDNANIATSSRFYTTGAVSTIDPPPTLDMILQTWVNSRGALQGDAPPPPSTIPIEAVALFDDGLVNQVGLALLSEFWAGNIHLSPEQRLESTFIAVSKLPINLQNMRRLEDAVIQTLITSVFGKVTANVTNPEANRLTVLITLQKPAAPMMTVEMIRIAGIWEIKSGQQAYRRLLHDG